MIYGIGGSDLLGISWSIKTNLPIYNFLSNLWAHCLQFFSHFFWVGSINNIVENIITDIFFDNFHYNAHYYLILLDLLLALLISNERILKADFDEVLNVFLNWSIIFIRSDYFDQLVKFFSFCLLNLILLFWFLSIFFEVI